MSNMATMLNIMADAIENGTLGGCDLRMIARTLEAVPEEYHEDAVRAALGADKTEDEAPEDYAVVKTFNSSIFHIGDEIKDGHGVKGLFAGYDDDGLISVIYAEGCVDHWSPEKWHRTGRNFPAIAAILAEIKK